MNMPEYTRAIKLNPGGLGPLKLKETLIVSPGPKVDTSFVRYGEPIRGGNIGKEGLKLTFTGEKFVSRI